MLPSVRGVTSANETFSRLSEEEPGTFYLTDFLAKHFDALMWQGLGLDRPAITGHGDFCASGSPASSVIIG